MSPVSSKEKLDSLLATCTFMIGYTPFGDEPMYIDASLPQNLIANLFHLPSNKSSDPLALANLCSEKYKDEKVCILIPGRIFDIYCTRYGRGGGWYDHFLSSIPQTWLRIGITASSRLSSEKLIRQSWDEPMDWILAHDPLASSWEAHETLVSRK